MIIQCDKCATKFRLDDSRITPSGVKVRCTKCDNVFIVTPPPPPEEVQVEEFFGVAPGEAPVPAAAGGLQAKTQPAKPKEDDRHLAFDFSGSEIGKEDIFKETDNTGGDFFASGVGLPSEKADAGQKFSLDDLDFSFSEDRSKEDKAESWGIPDEPFVGGPEKSPTLGEPPVDDNASYSVNFGEEPEKEEKPGPDFSFDDLQTDKTGADELEKGWPEAEKMPSAPEPKKAPVADVIPFQAAAAYTKEGKAPAASKPSIEKDLEGDDEPFKAVLSKTIDRDEPLTFGRDDAEDDEEMMEDEEEAPRRASHPRMGLIVAALIIVLGGGLIYFTGIIDRLTGLIMPPASSELKVVEIEAIKGFVEENKNFGKVFVIDAVVKNITDEPQEIKAATGVIYNEDGDMIAEKSVSPGRMVSIDDVRNLQKEELERAFRDPSGGVIPAKGSVPVMVLFVDVPEGVSEFGVDIVR